MATVELEGELDIASAAVLDATLDDVERGGATTLTLDLARVRFMDSTGLRSLLRRARRAETAGRRLRWRTCRRRRAVLDATGSAHLDIASLA